MFFKHSPAFYIFIQVNNSLNISNSFRKFYFNGNLFYEKMFNFHSNCSPFHNRLLNQHTYFRSQQNKNWLPLKLKRMIETIECCYFKFNIYFVNHTISSEINVIIGFEHYEATDIWLKTRRNANLNKHQISRVLQVHAKSCPQWK